MAFYNNNNTAKKWFVCEFRKYLYVCVCVREFANGIITVEEKNDKNYCRDQEIFLTDEQN